MPNSDKKSLVDSSRTHVVSIGYGKGLFSPHDPDRSRLLLCAKETESLHVVVFSRMSDGLERQAVDQRLFLYPTNSKFKLAMIFDAVRIVIKIIKSLPGRVVVTTQDPFEAGLAGLFVKWWCKVTLVVQEHADVFSTTWWRHESLFNQLRYWFGRFVLTQADVVRVVAERIERTVRDLGIAKPITLLPVAIDVDTFLKPICHNSGRSFESGTFTFITAARLVKQKNIPLMVRAFAVAHQRFPKARLVIVGRGPEAGVIKGEIAKCFPEPSQCPIKMIDWSQNLPCLLQHADAYLLSSNYEGWGRVLIEALCVGLPVVTTDVGCVGEVVIDGVHGIVTPVGDEEAFSKAIETMVGNHEVHQNFKDTINRLDKKKLPGADLGNYGKRWLDTLSIPYSQN